VCYKTEVYVCYKTEVYVCYKTEVYVCYKTEVYVQKVSPAEVKLYFLEMSLSPM